MQIDRAYDFGGEVDWEVISRRLGKDFLEQRVQRQNQHYLSFRVRLRRFLTRQLVKSCASLAFKVTGLYRLGQRNFLDIQVFEREVFLPRLPAGLDGFRVTQISDLHIDLDPGLAEVVAEKVRDIKTDLTVLTGDFRNLSYGDFRLAVGLTGQILEVLQQPVFGILGNHDYIEMAPVFEEMGMKMLLNEAVPVYHHGETLWLAGIDDPHLYETHDLSRATASIPGGAFSILLSHAPEPFREAEASGFDLFLCGHTHGGQICLPGGVPILTHCRAPRALARGAWKSGTMQGYTTTGTGGCGAPLRLHCRPEIVVHILRCGSNKR